MRVSACYLAHPIDFVGEGKRSGGAGQQKRIDQLLGMREWLGMARKALGAYGFSQYSPGLGWSTSGGLRGEPASTLSLAAISATNRAAMEDCDCLVAVLPAGVATIGTVLEIERAVQAGKPCVLILEHELIDKSASVRDWLEYDNVWLVGVDMTPKGGSEAGTDLDEAIEWLSEQEPAEVEYPTDNPIAPCEFTVGEGGKPPTRSYEGDAGFDLYCSQDVNVEAGSYVDIPTSVRVALPPGYWALVTGRSSAWRKRGLLIVDGVIDNGYRGELFSAAYNPGPRDVEVAQGDRLAQMILLPYWGGSLVQTEQLSASERGTNGFGSSGA